MYKKYLFKQKSKNLNVLHANLDYNLDYIQKKKTDLNTKIKRKQNY